MQVVAEVAEVADTELAAQAAAEMETLEDQLHTVNQAEPIEAVVVAGTAVVQVETTAAQELW
jgi:hypothetical protein